MMMVMIKRRDALLVDATTTPPCGLVDAQWPTRRHVEFTWRVPHESVVISGDKPIMKLGVCWGVFFMNYA